MNFSLYLTELLKTNDCVIVPDLGGFIANYLPAASDPESDRFFPPVKELVFNSKLRKNDGLLVNFICEREDVGYLEARKMVSEYVSETIFKLESGEKIVLEGIGVLRYDDSEHLAFEAFKGEILRPDVFGLGAMHFPQLISKHAPIVAPAFRDHSPERRARSRSLVKYVMIAIPVLAAIYFVPRYPDYKTIFKPQAASTTSVMLTDSPSTLNNSRTVAPVIKQSEIKAAPETDTPAQVSNPDAGKPATSMTGTNAEPVASLTMPATGGMVRKYHVVGGCFKVRENADKLAARLLKAGYHPEVSEWGNNYFRVSVERFENRSDAETVLAKLQEAEPGNGYWLLTEKR